MGRFTDFKDPDGERPAMLPRIGKIGLGVKVATAKGERPSEVDYFVLDDPSCHIIADKAAKAGQIDGPTATAWKQGKAGPKWLPIMLTSEDVGLVAPTCLEWWGKGVLKCSGNGVEAFRLQGTGEKTTMVNQACPCEQLDARNGCRRQIRLLVMLPQVTVRGCFQIDSCSRATITAIRDDLSYVRQLFGGRIAGLVSPKSGEPLLYLSREAWTSTRDRRTHYKVRIQPVDMDAASLVKFRQVLLPGAPVASNGARLLPAKPGPEQPRSQGNDKDLNGQTLPPLKDAVPRPAQAAPPPVPDGVDPATGEVIEPGDASSELPDGWEPSDLRGPPPEMPAQTGLPEGPPQTAPVGAASEEDLF